MSYCDMGPDFYSDREVRAKKEYRCVECRAPILVGEKHLYWFGKWDGLFSAGRQHFACCAVCVEISKVDECIPFGAMHDYAKDYCGRGSRVRALYAKVLWRERPYRRRNRKAA